MGIGTSLRNSLVALLAESASPVVLFSPMKSRPRQTDVRPARTLLWCASEDPRGRPFEMPPYSLVTSGARVEGAPSRYTLVCSTTRVPPTPIEPELTVATAELSNVITGSVLGSSQVTAMVHRSAQEGATGTRYPVTVMARLVPPYVARLTQSAAVADVNRLDGPLQDERRLFELVRLRDEHRSDRR